MTISLARVNARGYSNVMNKGDTLMLHSRKVTIVSKPRRISGGDVVMVAWAEDNQEMRLADGTIHPAHRAGWQWEEPVLNLCPVPANTCEACVEIDDAGLSFVDHTCNQPTVAAPRGAYDALIGGRP